MCRIEKFSVPKDVPEAILLLSLKVSEFQVDLVLFALCLDEDLRTFENLNFHTLTLADLCPYHDDESLRFRGPLFHWKLETSLNKGKSSIKLVLITLMGLHLKRIVFVELRDINRTRDKKMTWHKNHFCTSGKCHRK